MKYEKRRAGFTHGKLSLTNSSSTLTSLRLFFVYFLFPLGDDAKNKLVWVQVHSSNVCAHTVLIIKFWLRIQLKHHPQSVYVHMGLPFITFIIKHIFCQSFGKWLAQQNTQQNHINCIVFVSNVHSGPFSSIRTTRRLFVCDCGRILFPLDYLTNKWEPTAWNWLASWLCSALPPLNWQGKYVSVADPFHPRASSISAAVIVCEINF